MPSNRCRLFGKYERRVDHGRVTLPRCFRDEILRYGAVGLLWAAESGSGVAEFLPVDALDLAGLAAAETEVLTLDARGRLRLPAEMIRSTFPGGSFAGIVTGAQDTFRLWSASAFREWCDWVRMPNLLWPVRLADLRGDRRLHQDDS